MKSVSKESLFFFLKPFEKPYHIKPKTKIKDVGSLKSEQTNPEEDNIYKKFEISNRFGLRIDRSSKSTNNSKKKLLR